MTASSASRQSALDRLTANAPFLARLAECHPDDGERFLAEGADAALEAVAPPPVDDDIMAGLRRWRGRIALLLARGDLARAHGVPGGPEERRVRKRGVRTWRFRGRQDTSTKKL